VVGINSAEIWITIAPDANYEATIAAIEWTANAYAGSGAILSSYPEERIGRILTGSTKDVVVRVYGEETALLGEQAETVKKALAGTRGLVDLEVENAEVEPTIEIKVDLAAAQRLGIKPGDVRRYATTLVSGLQVGSLFEEQKVFEVVVWSTPETRNSINSIRDLMIDTPTGTFVRLGDVANVSIVANPAVVKRESVSRYVDVTANVKGRSLRSVEDEIRTSLEGINFPIEYHAEIVTDKAGGVRMLRSSILPYVLASAIGVFLLLQAAFASWRLAAIAFFAFPVPLVGSVIATAVVGYDLSIGSYLGLLAVLGLSVRNGIELVGRYMAAERASSGALDAGLAVSIAGDRVVPFIMTALSVVAVLLPILFAGARAGLEITQPLAVAVLGGLLTLALLHLFILPAACLLFWPPADRNSKEFPPSTVFKSESQT
jgi:Cu/Ag efflux pump CusA